ncbi:MAG: zinc transporter [Limisphaerales bacterium]
MDDPCYVFGLSLSAGGNAPVIHTGALPTEAHWLHIDYSSPSAADWLEKHGLEYHVIDSLIRQDTRPRTVAFSNGVLVVLRGVNSNPGAEPEDMVSLRLWIEPGRLISVRQRRLSSVQDVRELIERGQGPRDIPSLVVAIVERLADRISDFVDTIEDQALTYEESVESGDVNELRRKVNALRRQTAVVRRFLAPQRDALEALHRQANEILGEGQSYSIREQSDRITRYVEDLDLVRERALVIQEELLNRIALEQNSRMFVLSIVAAIFLPITFITGLLGMNVAGLPGTESADAFWIVSGAMLVFGVSVAALFRIKRWF